MNVIRLEIQNGFATNSYIVLDNKEAVLIDAPADSEYILSRLKSEGLTLKKILLTHGHCDHIMALYDLVLSTKAEVLIHSGDEPKLRDTRQNLADFFKITGYKPFKNAVCVEDGSVISLGDLRFKVLHTPGHTGGSVCFVCENVIFSGDTLFYRSIGRTDMIDGDYKKITESLKKLSSLKGNYTVYPGHGPSTTLDYEKKNNPFMQVTR